MLNLGGVYVCCVSLNIIRDLRGSTERYICIYFGGSLGAGVGSLGDCRLGVCSSHALDNR